MTSAFLCINLTSVASAVSSPSFIRAAAVQSIDSGDYYNQGFRSHFTTSTWQTPAADRAGQAFWVGETLLDGTFYQAGIAVCGSQCLRWFAQAYDASNRQILNWVGTTLASGTGYHDVAIQVETIEFGLNNWYPTFDNVRPNGGNISLLHVQNSGTNVPEVAAELSLAASGGPMPNPNSQLGPLTATDFGTGVKALQTKSGNIWRDTLRAQAFFVNQVCLPINVYGWGYQSASMGNFTDHACAVDYNRLGNW
jgi:hypothetical protein